MTISLNKKKIPNCWDFMNCKNGPESKDKCIAIKYKDADGFLCGANGGHACMFIANTKCGGSFMPVSQKIAEICSNCDFYKLLEERYGYLSYCEFLDYRSKNLEPNSIDY